MILGWRIFQILDTGTENMSLQNLGDYLRDQLAKAKENGLISTCGFKIMVILAMQMKS
jgi:hypothetical protein